MTAPRLPRDNLDRDRFYSLADSPEEDIEDYELEAPDPELEEARERHAREVVADAESRIDVDELLRDQDSFDHDELLRNLFRGGKFRFQTKHLLIATALLALYLTIGRLAPGGYMFANFLFFISAVGGALFLLNRRERRHAAELAERKRALRAEFRREEQAASEPLPSELDEAWEKVVSEAQDFRFSFSLQQLMVAFTIAAVVMGLVVILGGFNQLALLLGLVAAFGLIIYAVGVEPPAKIVLAWWVILALYVILSIGGMIWTAVMGQ